MRRHLVTNGLGETICAALASFTLTELSHWGSRKVCHVHRGNFIEQVHLFELCFIKDVTWPRMLMTKS